jgi:[protein-PII] uridylyltransferase
MTGTIAGRSTSRNYANLTDRFIRDLFGREQVRSNTFAVLALGGYGRRELCFGSDIDLLLVHQGPLTTDLEEKFSQILYPLWDAKLEVGHAVLTVQECIRLALDHFRSFTSLLDARFLVGSYPFFRLFSAALWSRISRENDLFLDQFLTAYDKREKKFGGQDYFVEPEIKRGLGGLRDLHYMTWVARVFFKANHLSDIRRYEAFSHFDAKTLGRSQSFLFKVRNHLHAVNGRKEDRLLLAHQKVLAGRLNYRDGPQATGPEKFMKQFYSHMNRIHYSYEEFFRKALDILRPIQRGTAEKGLPEGIQATKGNISLSEGKSLSGKDLGLLPEAFKEANRRMLSLSSDFIWEARRAITRWGRRLVDMPEAKAGFLDLITNPVNSKILRQALEIGLIDLFIPEFKRIRNLALFSYYHRETVDLHAWRTVVVLQDIAHGAYDSNWPLFREVFHKIERPDRLFLAGLLHDIGKGYRGDHTRKGVEIIEVIGKRLGLDRESVRSIGFLVEHHLLLVHISQKRDLHEERTAIQTAQLVGHKEGLYLLFLLSAADSLATGHMAGSNWKMMLLTELFIKVEHILERGSLASPDARMRLQQNKEGLRQALRKEFDRQELKDMMDQVSTRYYLNAPFDDMVTHFRLAMTMGKEKLSWRLRKLSDAHATRVVLCTHDKPGLFSHMVGVFALNHIDVLGAHIFTLKNGLAFDFYDVTNPLDPLAEEAIWQRIFQDATKATSGELPLEEMIREKTRQTIQKAAPVFAREAEVGIDNTVSDFFSSIEVNGMDRFGLLYDLATEIFSQTLDIRFAKVISDGEKMTGVFYVKDNSGQKVYDDQWIDEIKYRLLAVMGAA